MQGTRDGGRQTKHTRTSSGQAARRRLQRAGLLQPRPSRAGRNAQGRRTVRHRGGGHKRRVREVLRTAPRRKEGDAAGPWTVVGPVYDPGRGGPRREIAHAATGARALVDAVEGRHPGAERFAPREKEGSRGGTVVRGQRLPLAERPLGVRFHGRELRPGAGGRRIRAPGTWGEIVNREGGWARVRLPSGEVRRVPASCEATVGTRAPNPPRRPKGGLVRRGESRGLGKAGRSRWLGRRPTVRGVARNPVDHPHGGGEGRTSGGRPSVTPWSRPQGARTTSGRGARFVVVPRLRRKGTTGGVA